MTESLRPATRLWNLVREEKSEITAIYFFSIVSGLIQMVLPVGIQAIIGFVLSGTMSAALTVLIIALVLAVLFTGIVRINQMRVVEKVQQRIFVRYSFAFADRIPKLDLKKVDGFYLPELVNRFFDTVSLQKGFAKLLLDLPPAIIQIVFGLILLSFYHSFFILFGVLLLISLWLFLKITGNKGLHTSFTESTYKYGVVAWLEEMARLVKSFKFSNADLHLTKADQNTGNYLSARTVHFKVLEFQYKVLVAFKVLITAAMLIVGVLLLLNQQINVGQFVAVELIIIIVIASIEKIITNLDMVYDVITALEKIGKLTDKPVENGGSYQLESSYPISIQACGLGFGYGSRPVVSGLNFSIKCGDKICIKGAAGSGKSTVLKLLAGVYHEFEGQLLVNKIPINNYDLKSLREKMGILFQHENIFNGTLWENLTMGRPDVDKLLVNELCEKAGLLSFLHSLPTGYDTELDPTGKRLPRSVVQKILLVRALAHKPSLIIMEEPLQDIEEEYRRSVEDLILNAVNTTVIVATTNEDFCKRCNQTIQLEVQKAAL